MALTSVSNVKSYLSINESTDDTILTTLVSQAEKIILDYLGKNIESATYTEYHDGDGTDEVHLKQYPIISVTSLYDDVERVFNSTTLIAATNYIIYEDEGIIRLFNDESSFAVGKRNIKVAYTAGYASVPGDITLAANKLIAHLFHRRGADGHTQETLGSYSTSYDKSSIPIDVLGILDMYKRIPV